jgi:hypothetical protein
MMKTQLRWLAVLAMAAMTLPAVSCGDDDNTPTDGGTDDTTRPDVTDTPTDTGENCTTFPPNPAVPTLRLRTMNVTAPAAMQNAILQALINDSMNDVPPLFVWLMEFNGVGTGTITLSTGSGRLQSGRNCTFEFLAPTYPPADITMYESGLEFSVLGDPIPRLDVPLWSTGSAYPDPPLLVMPLRELEFGGTFSSDHLFVGSFSASTEEWTDGGTITGKITVEDAKNVVIEDLGMNLCGLLSGDTRTSGNPADDCTSDPTTWTRQPDTTVGTDPAYRMSATFAASPVYIP